MIHQRDRNLTIAPFSKFCSKIFSFCLKTGKVFILKPTEKGHVLLKNGNSDFQNNPSIEILACIHVIGNFERFQYSNFEMF